jgi:hypothetical protein
MKNRFLFTLIIVLVIGFAYSAIPNDTQTWIRIGSLNSHVEAWGAERGWDANLSSYIGMQWPAQYDRSDNFVIDRQFMACKNFTLPDGAVVNYKSVKFTNRSDESQIIPQSLVQSTQYPLSSVTVNGVIQTSEDEIIEHFHSAAESPADRVVTNVVRTAMGVTMTRKVYAFSRKGHDNYNIIEYTFDNTGNVDDDDSLEINSTIQDFYFGLISRFATSREAYYVDHLRQASWGAHQWVHHTPMNDDPDLPCYYTWLGQAQTADITLDYDNIGVPVLPSEASLNDARIRCPQFAGTAILHSDQAYDNSINDKSKVRLGWYVGDDVPAEGNDQQIWTLLNDNYNNLCHTDSAQDVYAGHEIADRMSPYSVIDHMAGTSAYMSFGPYDIPFGESVKIVICEAVSGLSREKAIEVGKTWYKAYEGESVDLTLPPGPVFRDPEPIAAGADSMDIYKDMWVYTGKDSILKTFHLAKENYDSDFGIPLAPPPPETFEVRSELDCIDLQWADNSEASPNFEGYRVYRAEGVSNAKYDLIFDCNRANDNVVNNYSDTTTLLGRAYFYYVTAYQVDPLEGIIESGQVYTQTKMAAGMASQAPLGSGSYEDPYQICEMGNLIWLSMNQSEWNKHFVQTAHINAHKISESTEGFSPIGNSETAFTGIYDGQGYTIDSLFISRTEKDQIGLFGCTQNARISDLGLTHVQIAGYNEVGGLIGQSNSTVVQRCYVNGGIEGQDYVGGIAGKNASAFIDQCYNRADITGNDYVGGMTGANTGAVHCCYSTGLISAVSNAGGVTGSGNAHACFWDTETSGLTASGGGTGLTSLEMTSASTYINEKWDMANTWTYRADKNNGYPYLIGQQSNDLRIIKADMILAHSARIICKADTNTLVTGLCWNTEGDPTNMDNTASVNTTDSLGRYFIEASGLAEDTHYFIRAFNADSSDVIYSNTIVVPTTVFDQDGLPDTPYQVAEAAQLKWISEHPEYWDKHFIQTADINADAISSSFGSEGWSPIGYLNGTYLSKPFTGSFNGQGFAIDHLHLNRNSDYVGMFGYVVNAALANINMMNTNVVGEDMVGGLSGYIENSTIDSCHISGSVEGADHVGIVAGYAVSSTLSRCITTHSAKGDEYVGGILGKCFDTELNECNGNAAVEASRVCGGLIGMASESTISNCYADSSVKGMLYVGGLVSRLDETSVSKCYSQGNVTGSGRVGGLIGDKDDKSSVVNCFWDKQTSGQTASAGGNGKTSIEMKDLSTFANGNWVMKSESDDGIWNISVDVNDGYPVLSYLYPELPVPVLSAIDDPIPTEFKLNFNYPNPFNPTTALGYELPEQSDVQMIIFDISGRKIRQWSYQGQAAGTYKIKWNGKDSSGNLVPSGVYLYCLIADDFVDSKKMVLLK